MTLPYQPSDLQILQEGNRFSISATLTTQHEVEAFVTAVRLVNRGLPSTRKAIAGDFGMEPEPPETLSDRYRKAGLIP